MEISVSHNILTIFSFILAIEWLSSNFLSARWPDLLFQLLSDSYFAVWLIRAILCKLYLASFLGYRKETYSEINRNTF